MKISGNFFEKIVKFFGNFWTFKWQFSGGSALDPNLASPRTKQITEIKLGKGLGVLTQCQKHNKYDSFGQQKKSNWDKSVSF